ncbi:hypothetical protein [Chitinimonas sp. BJB300]|uniref:hypothetical protein n=1 Tax=Chitinimonas sp. BJB300 TaxID=1559339 RepID=UPI0013041CFC|nr:hypothetical protein [Chitinimonas sp. BJB300]
MAFQQRAGCDVLPPGVGIRYQQVHDAVLGPLHLIDVLQQKCDVAQAHLSQGRAV